MEQQNQNIDKNINLEPIVKKQNIFLVIILSVLLLISVSIAGLFAYQTQTLVKELTLLKSGQTPVSSTVPTPDPTAGWKTYMNENAGFLLKIPSKIEEVSSTEGLVSGPFEANPQLVVSFADKSTIVKNTDSPFDGFTIYMQEVAQLKMTQFTFEKYLNEELKNVKQSPRGIQSSEIIKKAIGGNEFSYIDYEPNIRKYFILSGDGERIALFSRVNSSQDFLNDFDQILSTFKFIDSNLDLEWNSYENTKDKYSFSYPQGWKIRGVPGSQIEPESSDIYFIEGPYKNIDTLNETPEYTIKVEKTQIKSDSQTTEQVSKSKQISDGYVKFSMTLYNPTGELDSTVLDEILSTFKYTN